MSSVLKGRVHRYGDNVNTDEIIPARYLNMITPAELAAHAMEDIDRDFVKNVRSGDFIVADENFGCGSSREHAPIAIKASGVSAVIAKSFARIFFRNAINIGLPVLVCAEAAAAKAGDELRVEVLHAVLRELGRLGGVEVARGDDDVGVDVAAVAVGASLELHTGWPPVRAA